MRASQRMRVGLGCGIVLLGFLCCLWGCAPSAEEILVQKLKDQNPQVREEAAAALVQKGQAAVPALIKALALPDDQLREQAGAVLVKIGSPAVPPLINVLKVSGGVLNFP